MSFASKVTLAASCCVSASIVAWVHIDQNRERARIHQGVIRDQERQERKRLNKLEMEEQQRLTQYLIDKQRKELEDQGLAVDDETG